MTQTQNTIKASTGKESTCAQPTGTRQEPREYQDPFPLQRDSKEHVQGLYHEVWLPPQKPQPRRWQIRI